MLPFKEHGCETEYQQSYRNSHDNFSATQTYLQNLNFRKEQKRRFVEHNPDPFEWDPEDIQSDSGSDFSCKDLNLPSALTPTQYKHEKLNRLYEKHLTDRQDSSHPGIEENEFSSRGWARILKPSKQSNQVVERKRFDDYYDYDSGSESETSVVHIIEPEFVIEPSTKPSMPFANKQTQTERKSSKVPGPFLPSGYEAGSAGKGKKMTHNMRATREIYPSALRAQRLKRTRGKGNPSQTTSSRCLSGKSCASSCLQKANPQPFRLFIHSEYDDDDDDGSPKWITEYDRSYNSHPEKDCRSANSS